MRSRALHASVCTGVLARRPALREWVKEENGMGVRCRTLIGEAVRDRESEGRRPNDWMQLTPRDGFVGAGWTVYLQSAARGAADPCVGPIWDEGSGA